MALETSHLLNQHLKIYIIRTGKTYDSTKVFINIKWQKNKANLHKNKLYNNFISEWGSLSSGFAKVIF